MKALLLLLAFTGAARAADPGIHCSNDPYAELRLTPYDHGYHATLLLDGFYVKQDGTPNAPKGQYRLAVDFDDRRIGCTMNPTNVLVASCQRNDFVELTRPDGTSSRIPAVIEIHLKEITVVEGAQTRSSRSMYVRVSSPAFEVADQEVPFGRSDSRWGEIGGYCETE